MHASLSRSCDENPRFDGTSPREGQEYLNCQWKKARAKLNRDAVPYFGFRIAEPQHDGTPHWHLLLFVAPENRTNLREIIRHYALEVDPDEPGAVKHRFKAVEIDWSKGSATGYVAKYVSKNIDGYGVKNDTYGKDAKSSAIRVEAWASTWRIRQFAQIGGPPVGVWRELRRLHGQTTVSSTVVAAAVAADKADWAGYVQAQGGAVCKCRDRPITLAKVWSDEPGRYGDPKGYSTIGIEENGVTILTRIHIWKILPKGSGGTLDHGADGRATHLRSGPRMAQPGGGQAADARTAGVPVSSVPLEFCQ
jgi:hypothetical protein